MTPAALAESPASSPSVGALLRAIWFVLIPIALGVLCLRYLVPSPLHAPPGALRELAGWFAAHRALGAIGLVLLFSWLIRYWRGYLPAAELWSEPPASARQAQAAKSAVLWALLMLLAVGGAFAFRSTLFQSYTVLSGSMLPTLQPNDVLLSTQSAYGLRWSGSPVRTPATPKRGDIVVFRHAPIGPDVPEELVKRVIALPGDSIVTQGGYAFINGWRIPTCNVGTYSFVSGESMLAAQLRMEFLEDSVYLTAHGPWEPEPRAPYLVKSGEVFVLGDNRNNSSDSRAWNDGKGGGLPLTQIRGRVDRVLVGQNRDGSWDSSRAFERIGLKLHTPGIDASELEAGVQTCLKNRPQETRPPAKPPEKPVENPTQTLEEKQP